MAGWPVRFDGKTAAVKPAPLLGQHSAEVLKDWLGMSEDQVAALRAEKIICAAGEVADGHRSARRHVGLIPIEGEMTMAEVTGSEILAKCLKKEGTKDLFFIMGGPMQLVQTHVRARKRYA